MNPFIFLIDTLIYFYTLLLMLRVLFQWVRADFYNPVAQFVVKVTSPLVVPLRRIVPSIGRLDLATLLLVMTFICLKLVLISWILGLQFTVLGLFMTTLIETVILLLDIFLFSILILVIMSWLNPDPHHPTASLLRSISSPVMRPLQKLIPPTSGIDFSPMVALLIIYFIKYSLRYFF